MTDYDKIISRSDAGALIPEEVAGEIIKSVTETNPLLKMARKLPNMSRKQKRMPVMSALAAAYFVSGDTGLKKTTEVNWANKYIDAEELAVIVPIPESVLDDQDYDIWAEIKPELETAFNVAVVQAVLYGTNIPATWTTNLGAAGLKAGATAAGHVLSLADYDDLYDAVLAENEAGDNGMYMAVEEDGFMVSGNLAHTSMKGKLRGLRDANGNPIFKTAMQSASQYELDGAPLEFPRDGSIDPAESLMIAGQWDQLVYAMRQDITYKILTEAVITDNSTPPQIIYNLAQQDMVALRAVIRLGFALPNPKNRMNQTDGTRFPFSFLTE